VKSVYGDKAPEAWAKLKGRVLTVTPGWSEAYGLFTKGEAPMVLSYTTSPAYHMVSENTDRYQAAAFSEGHYIQIEVAGLLKNAPDKALAQDFLKFMVTHGLPGHDPDQQLDDAGRRDLRTPARCLRQAGQPVEDLPDEPRRGRAEPQGLDRRVAGGDEHQLMLQTASERHRALTGGALGLAVIVAFVALATIALLLAVRRDVDRGSPVRALYPERVALHAAAGGAVDAVVRSAGHPDRAGAGAAAAVSRSDLDHPADGGADGVAGADRGARAASASGVARGSSTRCSRAPA
jgi:hypothetical protein